MDNRYRIAKLVVVLVVLQNVAVGESGKIVGWGSQVVGVNLESGFEKVAAGVRHSVGLKADGSIVAWGENCRGQCLVPKPNTEFREVAAGLGHSLGLKNDGSIVALGWRDAEDPWGICAVPLPNADFTAVAAGQDHSLGLKSDGSIVAWGDNRYGQCTVPTPNADFTKVAAGVYHSLGLKRDGSILAWGHNEYGQCVVPIPNNGFTEIAAGGYHSVGIKDDDSIVAWGANWSLQCYVPNPNTDFTKVAAGYSHNLGLKRDGSIVAWGRNSDGQCMVPAPNTSFVAVAAGWWHSLGVKSDGSIVVWGANFIGQCNGPSSNTAFVDFDAGSYSGIFDHVLGLKRDGSVIAWGYTADGQCTIPTPNFDFISIAAGSSHSLGLKSNGSIVAWGSNEEGQCTIPTPNMGFTQIAAGDLHSLALKSNRSIIAWGRNLEGQCTVPAPNTDFVAVDAGKDHSLGLKSDGSIVAWGWNGHGQCTVPALNRDFVAIAAGYGHSLGLKKDGSIVAWGWNVHGQCTVPLPNTDSIAVAAGANHSVGLKSNGSVLAWGNNALEQCSLPEPNKEFVAISSAGTFSLALQGVSSEPDPIITLSLLSATSTVLRSARPARMFLLRIAPEVAGERLLVTLTWVDPSDANLLYARWGTLPTQAEHDFAADLRDSSGQTLIIPRARAEDLYILVKGVEFNLTPNLVTLLAESVDLTLTSISADSTADGGTGEVRMAALGMGFRGDTTFRLVAEDSTTISASDVTLVADHRAELTFELEGAPLGLYDIEAEHLGMTARLEDAFEVKATARGPELRTQIVGERSLRVRRPSRFILKYENAGDVEMPAPLFQIQHTSGPGTVRFRLERDTEEREGPIQVLGIHPDGVAGILPPGGKGAIPIFLVYEPEFEGACATAGSPCEVEIEVLCFDPLPGEGVGWDRAGICPEGMTENAWDAAWPALSAKLGGSWLEYKESLGSIATRLAHRGADASSVRDLFRFALSEAEGRASSAITSTVKIASSLEPLSGVRVAAVDGAEAARCGSTDGEGAFAVGCLEAGEEYEIVVEGYRVVSVSGGGSTVTLPAEAGEDLLALEVLVEAEPGDFPADCLSCDHEGLPEAPLDLPGFFTLAASMPAAFVSSWDPNDKTGQAGDDEEVDLETGARWISANTEIHYTIYFENTGGIAADTVTIADTLHPTLDLSTFTPGVVHVGANPPPEFNTLSVDRMGLDLSSGYTHLLGSERLLSQISSPMRIFQDVSTELKPVDINVEITGPDPETREVKWVLGFQSGEGLDGFLPPNDTLGQGEGHVSFTVKPRADLDHGEEIPQEASIQLDELAPVSTWHEDKPLLFKIRILERPRYPQPADRARGVESATPLRWEGKGASSYRVFLWGAGEERPSSPLAEVVECRYEPELTPPAGGTTYRWQVEALRESADAVELSPVWRFTTAEAVALPQMPTELNPPHGTVVDLSELVFSWEAVAEEVSYDLIIWPEGDTSAPVEISGLAGNRFDGPLPLDPGVTYNWQVRAWNSAGEALTPVQSFTLTGGSAFTFIRGDCDGGGQENPNVTDAIALLSYNFLGGAAPPCFAACDANGDGNIVSVTDAVYMLSFSFLGGPPPPAPHPECGPGTATDVALGCESPPRSCN
ncbi:MAG: hypothetical protein JXA57_12465 [Armatimonadetes bacterium]|nr:hypothetical protein [Armatimonadota bacterium]